jgi:hypothetical protein
MDTNYHSLAFPDFLVPHCEVLFRHYPLIQ